MRQEDTTMEIRTRMAGRIKIDARMENVKDGGGRVRSTWTKGLGERYYDADKNKGGQEA